MMFLHLADGERPSASGGWQSPERGSVKIAGNPASKRRRACCRRSLKRETEGVAR